MNIISARYLYDMEGLNRTHIELDLGNSKFKSVPINEENKDYQEILEWVADGNTITDNPPE